MKLFSSKGSNCNDSEEVYVYENNDNISITIVTPDKKEQIFNFALDPEGNMEDLITFIE